MNFSRIIFSGLLCLSTVTTTVLNAQPLPDDQHIAGELVPWPTQVDPLSAEVFEYLFDGQIGTLMEIKGTNFHITSRIPAYSVRSFEDFRSSSLQFVNDRNLNLRFSFNLMKKDAWLPDFRDQTVLDFVAWLNRIQNENLYTLINQGSGFSADPRLTKILSQNYHLIKLKEENSADQSSRELWFFAIPLESRLLVITFECPVQLLQANGQDFIDYLATLNEFSPAIERL